MLEGILLTVVLGYVAAYIVGKALTALVDWNCRRTDTPEKRQRLIQAMLDRQKREQELAGKES